MWQDWNFWFSLLTVIIAGIAIVLTIHQIRSNNKQQQQNVGLTLYPLRRDVLQNFSEKKYNEVFWDSLILFSKEIADGILSVGTSDVKYKQYSSAIKQYEKRMEYDQPELFEQYKVLLDRVNLPDSSDADKESLYCLCDQYKPIMTLPGVETKQTLDYRHLSNEVTKSKLIAEVKHLEVFLAMKDEIKKSIM